MRYHRQLWRYREHLAQEVRYGVSEMGMTETEREGGRQHAGMQRSQSAVVRLECRPWRLPPSSFGDGSDIVVTPFVAVLAPVHKSVDQTVEASSPTAAAAAAAAAADIRCPGCALLCLCA